MRLSFAPLKKYQYNNLGFPSFILIIFFLLMLPAVGAFGADVDRVIAIVNGFKITSSDVEKARQQLPKKVRNYPKPVVDRFLLDNLLNTRLVAEAARKSGIDKNKNVAKKLLRVEDQLLHEIFLQRRVEEYVTEEKLRFRYRMYLKSIDSNVEIRARHILVQTREQALEVIGRLSRGENFESLAKSVSTGPSGDKGGDLGYFTRDQMVAPFSAAAFSTPVGQITSRPVKTQFGWHVIKVLDKKILNHKPFDQIKKLLREEMANEYTESFIKQLRRTADIKTFLTKKNKAGDQSLVGVKPENRSK